MKNLYEFECGNVKVVERSYGQWAVTTLTGQIIVPFGKYDWIDSFDEATGWARVKIGKAASSVQNNSNRWGIIDKEGNEILPVEYKKVWNFKDKGRTSTAVETEGERLEFYFNTRTLSLHKSMYGEEYDDGLGYSVRDEPGWGCYEKYGGYNGYDDFAIDSAFEGMPDATWNAD